MSKQAHLDETECVALYYLIADLTSGNPESVFQYDPGASVTNIAAAKIFDAAKIPVPEDLAFLVADVSELGLPFGTVHILQHNVHPPVRTVSDLCGRTEAQLRAFMANLSFEDIPRALEKHGLQLKE